jgi:hypothetical protein
MMVGHVAECVFKTRQRLAAGPRRSLAAMKYDQTVIAYHGCDESTAERVLRRPVPTE